jgi:hypothetical protein
MSMALRTALLCAAILGSVVPASLASAQVAVSSDESRRRARELGEAGLAHFDAGRWEMALQKLEEADAVLPATTLRLYSARALVKLGRLVEAEQRYASAVAVELPADASPVLIEARATAASEREALLFDIPTLTVLLEPGTRLAALRIDARERAGAGPHRLDPGSHQVEVVTSDDTTSRMVVLGKRERRGERFGGTGSTSPAPTTIDDASSSPQKTLGYVSLGVGGAGLALWGVTGALALASASDNGCEGSRCAVADDELDGYRTLKTVSGVGFYTGLGFAALGAALVLTAPSETPANRASVRAVVRPGGVLAEARF